MGRRVVVGVSLFARRVEVGHPTHGSQSLVLSRPTSDPRHMICGLGTQALASQTFFRVCNYKETSSHLPLPLHRLLPAQCGSFSSFSTAIAIERIFKVLSLLLRTSCASSSPSIVMMISAQPSFPFRIAIAEIVGFSGVWLRPDSCYLPVTVV